MKNEKYKQIKRTYSSRNKPTSIPYTVYLNKIRSGIIEPVYILFGADHPGKDEFINELKLTDDYKIEVFDIPENETVKNERFNTFVATLFTPPLWGDKLLLVLKNFQNLPSAKQEDMLTCLSTLTKDYFAKVVVDSKYEKELNDVFAKYALPLMNFYAPDERNLIQYVYQMVSALGLVIDTESAKLLFDLVGTEFAIIQQELEKIKTYLGNKTRITQDIVLNACGFSKESSIEELIRTTFNRNRSLSLSNLFRLQQDRTFPSIVVSSLANAGLSLLQVKLGANRYMLNSGVKRFEALERQSNLWKQEELEKLLLKLAEIDKKIKTGYPEPYVLIENLLVRTGRN